MIFLSAPAGAGAAAPIPGAAPRGKGPGEIPGDARGGGPLPAQNSMISSVSGSGRTAVWV